jgi:transcriptional regulator of acetoin/glycerol metabolism
MIEISASFNDREIDALERLQREAESDCSIQEILRAFLYVVEHDDTVSDRLLSAIEDHLRLEGRPPGTAADIPPEQYQKALNEYAGNISAVARDLGVSRYAVYFAIDTHDLDRPNPA